MSTLTNLTKHIDFVRLCLVDRRLVADTLSMAVVKGRWVKIKFERHNNGNNNFIREIETVNDEEYASMLREGVQETFSDAAELYHELFLDNFDYFSGNIMLNGNDRIHNLVFHDQEQFSLLSSQDQSAVRQAVKVLSDTELKVGIGLKVDTSSKSLNLKEIIAVHYVDPDDTTTMFKPASELSSSISK